MENRENEGLKSLGRKTEYRSDYAPEVLETFENRHKENDYWVRFNCHGPEIHRGYWILHPPRGHIHLSLRQLRPSRNQIRSPCRKTYGGARIVLNKRIFVSVR